MSSGSIAVAELLPLMRHWAGGTAALPSAIDPIMLINEAGQVLCSAYSWNWLRGRSVLLDLRANQDYIDLPESFGDLLDVRLVGNVSGSCERTTMEQIHKLRNNSSQVTAAVSFFVAVNHRPPTNGSSPQYILELYPSPSADSFGGLSILFDSVWLKVKNDGDYVRLPEYCHPLYRQILMAVVQGYIKEDEATVSRRLADVLAGPLMAVARSADSSEQSNLGRLENGAAEEELAADAFSTFGAITTYPQISIADP